MAEALMTAIEHLRREVLERSEAIKNDQRIAELRQRIAVLNSLEELESQEKTTIGNLLDFGTAPESRTPGLNIEPDEFFRKDALEAAKLYLRKKGKPAQLTEIMDAIKRGGGDPGTADVLRTKLTRSTYQIAKVSEDFFGLVEFYEGKKVRSKTKKNGGAAADSSQGDDGEQTGAATSPESSSSSGPSDPHTD